MVCAELLEVNMKLHHTTWKYDERPPGEVEDGEQVEQQVGHHQHQYRRVEVDQLPARESKLM